MVEHNTETNETNVFCDRCNEKLIDEAYIFSTGDCLCKNCFDKSFTIKKVEDYINETM